MPTNKKKNRGKKKKSQKIICYHGSTSDNFHGEYERVIDEYFRRIQNFQGDPSDKNALRDFSKQFILDHASVALDSRFCAHLFAWCAREALKSDLRLDVHFSRIKSVLSFAFTIKYYYIAELNGEDVSITSKNGEKIAKYNKEIYTRQGAMKRIAREVSCDCFAARLEEIKQQEKVGKCFGCEKEFPKTRLHSCNGFGDVAYCGKECQKNHWPEHKGMCKEKKRIIKETKKSGHTDNMTEILKMKMQTDAMLQSMRQRAGMRSTSGNYEEPREAKLEKKSRGPLKAGDIIRLEELSAEEGQFNERRGIILKSSKDQDNAVGEDIKYTVIIEGTAQPAQSRSGKSYKELILESQHLKRYRPLSLPKGIERGRVFGKGWGARARAQRLAENLVRATDTYKPSEIVFMGEAASNFMSLPGYPTPYENLNCDQMEQLGGLLALSRMANIEEYDEEVVYALLEADPMVIDVVIMLFTCTPPIGTESSSIDYGAFDVDLLKELTPSQTFKEYVDVIIRGHMMLLTTLFYQDFYQAVIAVFRRSPLFHLFVRRLLLVISREIKGHLDGLQLADYCKGILDIVCSLRLHRLREDKNLNERFFMNPLPVEVGKEVLAKTASLRTFEEIQPVIQDVFSRL